ncbi:phosphopantetheine-binding protein, partial [Streptomyces sp. NPDC006617]|uniref:acyl carrier protein n=1 Tax=Streptomyces sp. NPDC006617 TaxID=3155354 RepID=UPI00339DBCA7
HNDHHHLLTTLAHLHTTGHTTTWPTTTNTTNSTSTSTTAKLPTYPFQHHTHWLTSVAPEEVPEPAADALTHASVPLLVRTHVAAIIGAGGPQAVDGARTFKDLGFDSIGAVEFHRRMCATSRLELAASLTFDHPTPDAVVAHVRSLLSAPVGGTAGLSPLLSRLDGVREVLDGGDGLDEAARGVVAARLRDLLGLCEGEREDRAPSRGGPEQLESASDSEVLDFISNELGIT